MPALTPSATELATVRRVALKNKLRQIDNMRNVQVPRAVAQLKEEASSEQARADFGEDYDAFKAAVDAL